MLRADTTLRGLTRTGTLCLMASAVLTMSLATPANAAPVSSGASGGLAGSIVVVDASAKISAQCKFTGQVTGGNQVLIAYEASATTATAAGRTTVTCFLKNRYATSDAATGTLPGPSAAASSTDTLPLAALSVCVKAETELLTTGVKTVLPLMCKVPDPIVVAAIDALIL